MNATRSALATSLVIVILTAVFLGSHFRPTANAEATERVLPPVVTLTGKSSVVLLAQAETEPNTTDESENGKPVLLLKYGDGKPDGKKSIGGTGEMIHFELPNTQQKVKALRIHASRYGTPQPPDEDIDITFVSDDETEIIDSQTVPYARFRRGENRWVTLKFAEPVEVPAKFWVIFDFGAERTKGVYVSYDTDTGGKHSRIGLPGADSREVDFGGDWMVQLMLTKP